MFARGLSMVHSLLLTLSFVSICSAIPADYVKHEARKEIPGWEKAGRIPKDALLPMRIALGQRNLERGAELLEQISNPESKQYGKHLTQEQVIELFQPSPTTVSSVKDWLSEHVDPGRITHSDNKAWFAFDATTEEAEKLLGTEFYHFQHAETGRLTPGCDAYHIPKRLVGHIDYIKPGIQLESPRKLKPLVSEDTDDVDNQIEERTNTAASTEHRKVPKNLKNCGTVITDDCIRALYNIPLPPYLNSSTKPQPNNALGVFEKRDTYGQESLDCFFGNNTPWIPKGTHPTFLSVDGAVRGGPHSEWGESDLDFAIAYPLVYPQEIKLFQVDDPVWNRLPPRGDGLFNTFLDAIDGSYCTYKAFGVKGNSPKIDPHYPHKVPHGYKGKLQCGAYKPTPVISFSYGLQEENYPNSYQKRQCNEFMKLGLQGVSVLFASGDHGAACGGDGRFSPDYPANCPWVTTVGATKLKKGRTVFDPEVAADEPYYLKNYYSSGGGFSNIYPTPEYQTSAVHTYLTKHKPPFRSYNGSFHGQKGKFNRGGRGIPDVSASGAKIRNYLRGKRVRGGGTSASAPIFASVINRINDERLAAGKSTLGFLNPALYKNPSMFNDITEGHNLNCNVKRAFSAVPGWDPVTGLGTPNYPKMLHYFKGLQ